MDGKGTAICVLIRVIRIILGCGWLRLVALGGFVVELPFPDSPDSIGVHP